MSVTTMLAHASDPTTLETTSLNSLTSTGTVTGAAFATGGYTDLIFELNITYPTNPTAGSVIQLSLLTSIDGGSTYCDAPNAQGVVGSFQLVATTSAQKLHVVCRLPAGVTHFKPYIAAITTGQTAASSGNTLKVTRYTPQHT